LIRKLQNNVREELTYHEAYCQADRQAREKYQDLLIADSKPKRNTPGRVLKRATHTPWKLKLDLVLLLLR
jgi:hypothetical protein